MKSHDPLLLLRLMMLSTLTLTGCASIANTPAPDAGAEPLTWSAAHTSKMPSIDGMIDPLWHQAEPLTVTVREAFGGGAPRLVTLRALYDSDQLYVLAQWSDATRSDMRDPYVWNRVTKQYDRPSKPDDQFALEFPLRGQFSIDMLTTSKEFVADVWHWKAGRSNLGGWVDDKRHLISKKPIKGAKEYQLGDHATVYIARPMDQGQASYVLKDKPTAYTTDTVGSYVARKPNGSVADVRGKGIHDGKTWTLEMSRKLNTGHADDALVDLGKDNRCAIAILDDELYWRHSVSQLLLLRFSPR